MGVHARISPSALARIIRCPGSVQATAHIPRTTNEAAAEGTLLHEIASDCVELGFEPDDFVGGTMVADGHSFTIGYGDGEVSPSCMQDALDWIREQPGRIFVEQRVQLDPWLPGQFGTLDIGIIHEDICTIFDWKFGYIRVELFDNEQLRAYALGFLMMLRALGIPDPKRFRIIIEQPRSSSTYRFYQPWEIALEDLLPFGEIMAAALAAADGPNPVRVAGEKQCFWCEAKNEPGGCYAHTEFLLEMVRLKFDELDDAIMLDAPPVLQEARTITPERRSFIVKHAAMFKKWLAHLDGETLNDAIAGKPTPGLKAVDGQKGDRKWIDPVAAEVLLVGALDEDAFTKKLKSPAQSESVLKPKRGKPGNALAWDELKKLITQDDGRPILVPESDPRPPTQTVDQKFDDEPETD